jgi:uncharacterized membrane protein
MTGPATDRRAYRLTSLDMVRGLVVVIMALDHVRDYFLAGAMQDPMKDPNVGVPLFFTRWITHFCAPVFVMSAGVSAGLMTKRRSPGELMGFLAKRGLWLLFVEFLIISTAFTFSPLGIAQMGGKILIPMQVIWAIGASMLVLSVVQLLGRRATLVIGIAIVLGHNTLDWFWPVTSMQTPGVPLWVGLHSSMSRIVGPWRFVVAYPILPWIGVMLTGFGASGIFELEPKARDQRLLRIGLRMVAAFIVLRAVDLYGDANHWQVQLNGVIPTVLDFLNTTKYPPSLLYVLMTIGPATILCSFADRLTGRVKDALVMFGRVPFAFYVAHFYLIHALCVLLGVTQGFAPAELCTVMFLLPKGYGTSLLGVYGVWALVLALLFPFCRWVAGVKARRTDAWLSYL